MFLPLCYNWGMRNQCSCESQNTEQNSRKLGSLLITDNSGKCLYASKSIKERMGYDAPEVIGKQPGDLWGGHMDRQFYDELWYQIREHKSPFVGFVSNQNKSGERMRERIHVAPIINEKSETKYYVEIQPQKTDTGERSFPSKFSETMSDKSITAGEWYSKLSTWTGIEEQIDFSPSMPVSLFIQKTFIEPTQLRFKERGVDYCLVSDAQNDSEAFQELYSKYYEQIYNYFLHHLSLQKNISQDLTQETFYRALKSLHSYTPGNSSYKTYLLRIAHNLLVNHYRKKTTYSIDDEQLSIIPDKDRLSKMLDRSEIWGAIKSLSGVENRVMSMRYKDGFSVREIAGLLDKTENAIKLILSRTRKKIRNLLND